MSFFSRIFKWVTGNATAQRHGSQYSTPATSAHDNTPIIHIDGALQISTVWACVTLLVETISSLPLFVYQTDAAGNRTKLPRSSRLAQVLSKSPNNRQTTQEFWEQLLLNYFLRGNCYARKQRDSKGEIVALWPMAADQIEVIQTEDGTIFYKYYIDTKTMVFESKDVFHIKGMGNGLIGLSPLDYMRSSLGLAINSQNHLTKTYDKNGRRPGILMSDMVLTTEQRAALKLNFADIVSGDAKELYILEAQFKFEPLGMTPADIQLLETRQFSVQDLARWFGVPSVLINDIGQGTALGSSVTQIIEAFFKLKLRPQLNRFEKAIEKNIFSAAQRGKGYTVEFNFDALLRAALKERMEIYARAAQNAILTRNEIRRMENLPPIEGGDDLTAQVNLIPIGKLGETQPMTERRATPPEPIEQ